MESQLTSETVRPWPPLGSSTAMSSRQQKKCWCTCSPHKDPQGSTKALFLLCHPINCSRLHTRWSSHAGQEYTFQ